MKKILIKTLLVFSLSIICISSYSQYAKVNASDSIQNNTLNKQFDALLQLERALIEDSLHRAKLEKDIDSLKSYKSLQRQEMVIQLEALKNNDSVLVLKQRRKIDSMKCNLAGFPVAPFGDTLFFIYSRLGSYSPQFRSENINERIIKLGENYFFKSDSLRIDSSEITTDVMYGEEVIVSVTHADALWSGSSKLALAETYIDKISSAIVKHNEETGFKTLAKNFLIALVVLLILIIIILIISRLFKWINSKIFSQKGKRVKSLHIGNYELLDEKRATGFLLSVSNILKWLIIISFIYLALPVLFRLFPWTKGFSDKLISYVLDPLIVIFNGIWNYLPDLITVIVIIVVFSYASKALQFFKNEVENGSLKLSGFYPDWAAPTFQIVRILLFAFMLVVIFPYLPGSDSPVFQGVSVFLGVLFTFGSSGSLSNIIAGLVLTYMRAFKIGDRVKIGELTGDIIERSMLVTRIRTIKNEIISIPNATVMNSHTINFSSDAIERGLIINTKVTIGYDAPWRTVHKLLTNAALNTDMIDKEQKPFVLQTSLDDFYVTYQINAFTHEPNLQAGIYSQLHQNIQDEFNKAGVEIMSPHYSNLRDGNQTTIPADYLAKDYVKPSFNFNNKGEETK